MNRVLSFFYDGVVYVVGPVMNENDIKDQFEAIVSVRPNHIIINFKDGNSFVRANFANASLEARAYPLDSVARGYRLDDDEE